MVRLVKYFRSTMPSWVIFNIDIIISVFSLILAYLLRFNFSIPADYPINYPLVLIVTVSVRCLTFYVGKTSSMIIRHSSIRDIFKLLVVLFIGTILNFVINIIYRFFYAKSIIPLSVILIDFFIVAYLLTTMRLIIKVIFSEFRGNYKNKENVLIIGSNELAVATKRALDLDVETKYKVIAFLDDKRKNQKKNIEGIEIYPINCFEKFINENDINILIFAKDYVNSIRKNEIITTCLNHKIKVLTSPKINKWSNNELSPKQLKQINIEDLLERDPIKLDFTNIKKQIYDKTILVTGAAGSIGSEIVRQICKYNPKKIILLDQAETPLFNLELELIEKINYTRYDIEIADITNVNRLNYIFSKYIIDIVYHAAAYKHVPMMENSPLEAINNNVIGTKNLADLSVKFGVKKFVMISTDKAVNPTNIMGASKRIAEMYIQSLTKSNTSFITTRFGNVLGSNGSAIPLFKKQIEDGGPITITHPEITRYFMTIPEACQLVLEASAMGKGGEIFIFDMGKSIKILDIVKNMIRLSGLEIDKDIKIKYVGLRPGEKLFEELLCDKENTLPTHNPKIMIAKVATTDFLEISEHIIHFENLIFSNNILEIVKLMKLIIPEYKSQNSIYEVLDKSKINKLNQNISIN
jgi:FlaA1/EpsC-like NDP-sugar epimerase